MGYGFHILHMCIVVRSIFRRKNSSSRRISDILKWKIQEFELNCLCKILIYCLYRNTSDHIELVFNDFKLTQKNFNYIWSNLILKSSVITTRQYKLNLNRYTNTQHLYTCVFKSIPDKKRIRIKNSTHPRTHKAQPKIQNQKHSKLQYIIYDYILKHNTKALIL